jgi:hypothetical protein
VPIPRKPVEPGKSLPKAWKNWKPLVADDRRRFLTDNQLSVFVDAARPGLERIQFYPLPFPPETRGHPTDADEFSKLGCLQGLGPSLAFDPETKEYSYHPHLAEKRMSSGSSRMTEKCAVSGDACILEWRIRAVPSLALSFSLPSFSARAAEIENGLLLTVKEGLFIALAVSGTALSSVKTREEGPFELKAFLKPGKRATVRLALACGYDRETVRKSALRAARNPWSVFESAEKTWDHWFTRAVPNLTCSDKDIERLWYHHAWATRANLVDVPFEPFHRAYTCCGKTSASWQERDGTAVAAIQERWLNDKDVAAGGILLLARNGGALGPGSFLGMDAGRFMPPRDPGSLIGPWELYLTTGDKVFLREALALMVRAEAGFRGAELAGGLYASRIAEDGDRSLRWRPFVPDWKEDGDWISEARVVRVDWNCHWYALRERILHAAAELGDTGIDRDALKAGNVRLREAVRRNLWDEQAGFFFDADPRTLRRSDIKSIAAFTAMYSGIADERETARLVEHFTAPAEFAAPWPCPSVSLDTPGVDPSRPLFGGDCQVTAGLWFTVEGLAVRGYADLAADTVLRAVRMQTREGETSAADSYDTATGKPNRPAMEPRQGGLIVADLICRHLLGIRPRADGGLEVNPAALERSGLKSVAFGPYDYRGKQLTLRWSRAEGMEVRLAPVDTLRTRLAL